MPIFDQGYQHWSGQLSGHAWRWLAITRHGVRVGLTNRWLRIFLFMAWLPALVLAAMLCLWGLVERNSALITSIGPLLGFLDPAILAGPRPYRVEIWTLCYSYFLWTELRFSMILILLVGPNLISQDLRYNALPLYFSRPLRRIDYFLGKLGVIVAFLGMVIIVPSLAAYVLGLLFSLDITIVRDTFGILLASIAYGLVIAVSAGLLILALSSLSRNSRYVALFWLGIWFVSSTVSGVLLIDRPPTTATSSASRGRSTEAVSSSWTLSSRPPKRTGGRWFPTPPICRGSASNCSGPNAVLGKAQPIATRPNAEPVSARASWARSIRGIGRPPCWPAYLDFRHAF